MASRTPFNFPRFRAFDSNGDPLSGGKVYFYEAGTTTAKTTWSDPDLTVANTQPIVLDSAGEADIYLNDQAYKIVLDDADDVQQWTLDEYVRSNSAFSGNVDPPHAIDSGTDAFTGNSGLTLKAGQVYTWDFQSANTTTTPTLNDNSQGAKTIKRRNGIAVLVGDITGIHRLEYDGTDYILLDPTLEYESDPADATDGGTDAFTADSGRTLLSGQTYKFDFQSSNTTTNPTLDDGSQGAKTIKTRDGNALWAGALNGVHTFQYDGTDWLVLDPRNGIVERGSNSNGEYVRFGNGVQVCWAQVNLTFNTSTNVQGQWTYPATFIASPKVQHMLDLALLSVTPGADELGFTYVRGVNATDATLTQQQISGMTLFQSGDTAGTYAVAVGYWK